MKDLLKGQKVKLRALEPEDIDLLYLWENDPSVWQVSNTVAPYSRQVIRDYLESAHLDIYATRQLRLVIETIDDVPIGCVDLFDFDPQNMRGGVGILISAEGERGKGFATEALELFIEYAFSTLHLHQLHCTIAKENAHSHQLFQKNGFQDCGIIKDWVKDRNNWKDVKFYQLVRED